MIFFVVAMGVVGLAIGSFLGALIYRIPREIQFTSGRSLCPRCGKKISWFDNIPLISFLLLGGKCRNCHKKISLRYPLVELATAVGFILIGLNLYLLAIFSLLMAIFVIDIEHQIIPDSLVFLLLFLATCYILLATSDIFLRIASGFSAALFLLAIYLLTRGRGMGLGDVKFAIFGGLFLSWPGVLVWMFLSFLTGGLVGIILILLGKAKLKGKIAFGPFLIVGLFIAYLWGEKLYALFY